MSAKKGDVSMKLFRTEINIVCGEYGFLNTRLIVAKNLKEADKKAKDIAREENLMYSGETYYKLNGVSELTRVDSYQLHYQLEKV